MGSLPGSRPSDLTAPLLADVGADDAGTQTTKVSHLAALRAGAMLGQMCERSLIEHQLSACYFAFHNFCEHAPGYSSWLAPKPNPSPRLADARATAIY